MIELAPRCRLNTNREQNRQASSRAPPRARPAQVLLPASLLEHMLRTSANLALMLEPMMFKLTNPSTGACHHVGVLEFDAPPEVRPSAPDLLRPSCAAMQPTANSAKCRAPPPPTFTNQIAVVPSWICRFLGVVPDEGNRIELERRSLPKGSFAKLQPLTGAFAAEIEDPKATLEAHLSSYFTTLAVR